jgi:hypothetical protein
VDRGSSRNRWLRDRSGRRSDQADDALLDIRKQQILLGLVEPVELVDEEDGAGAGPAPGIPEDLAQLGHVGHDRVHAHKGAAGLPRDRLRDACLSAAGRAVEEQRAEPVLGHQAREKAARPQDVVLAHDLGKPARPHTDRQGPGRPSRRCALRRRRLRLAKELALVCGSHVQVVDPSNLRPFPPDEKPFSACHWTRDRRMWQSAMKSAYELAMERLSKSDPQSPQGLTPEKRAKLADVDRVYLGRIAERDIFLKQRLEQALSGRDADEVEKIRKQIASERGRLEEERESEKDRIRSGKA